MPRGLSILSRLALLLLPCSAIAALAAAPETPKPPRLLAVRAGRLLDGHGGPPLADAVILISGDRITAVGRDLPIPAGAEVVDLSRQTVLPGLIDCHTHLTQQSTGDYYEGIFRRTPIDAAVVAHVYAAVP